jgi:hypothetical protein
VNEVQCGPYGVYTRYNITIPLVERCQINLKELSPDIDQCGSPCANRSGFGADSSFCYTTASYGDCTCGPNDSEGHCRCRQKVRHHQPAKLYVIAGVELCRGGRPRTTSPNNPSPMTTHGLAVVQYNSYPPREKAVPGP